VFDVGPAEFIALATVALIVFGPDRLPAMAARAGRFVRQARGFMAETKRDVRQQLGPELADVKLSDLNGRGLASKLTAFGEEQVAEVGDEAPARPSPQPLPTPEDTPGRRDTA